MKKSFVIGLIVVLILVLLAFYFLNNWNSVSYEKTVSQLGFNVSEQFSEIPAKLVCQNADCMSLFPTERLSNCNSLWNSSYERPSPVGKPVYYATAVLNCENKKYVYYSESPPTKIRIAELQS